MDPREHQNWAGIGKCNLLLLHGKHGVETRIVSLNKDNSHSWVRISHGSNKIVMNLNSGDQEIPEDQLEEQAL